ncbi:AAA family ATPase [Peribacillus frigoritolerans]|uniref:AAA family ATPase n=1 Tax=Peribacillus frigoritolerans TaxID=450367 RepID=UPI001F4FBC38|nr:AAA family ATPase [Peribacillus frigoritolerans]MCK2020920.1 AAA family ATPase [Peribacillus frigoritolerans]
MTFPLFIVTGLSGSGKSTTAKEVKRIIVDFYVFDMDIIVNNDDYQTACNNWMKIAYYNALSGRNTILFGNVPQPYNIHICDHSHLFDPIYLHLHCNDAVRTQRLNARKVWDAVGIQHTLKSSKEMVDKAQAAVPPIPIIDTSNTPVLQVAEQIKKWVKNNS